MTIDHSQTSTAAPFENTSYLFHTLLGMNLLIHALVLKLPYVS